MRGLGVNLTGKDREQGQVFAGDLQAGGREFGGNSAFCGRLRRPRPLRSEPLSEDGNDKIEGGASHDRGSGSEHDDA